MPSWAGGGGGPEDPSRESGLYAEEEGVVAGVVFEVRDKVPEGSSLVVVADGRHD